VTGQRGYIHFINEVSEERRLRQDFGVEERGARLKRDGQQLLQPMEPARRVDVVQRNGEDHSPHQSGQPACRGGTARRGAPADGVVALVDGLQQRIQVTCGPGFDRSCQQHQRQASVLKTAAKRVCKAAFVDHDDSLLDRPPELGDPFGQWGDDGFGSLMRQAGKKDDMDARGGKGVALEVGRKRVVKFLARRHSNSSGAYPVTTKQSI
jgi:hypothetical protein